MEQTFTERLYEIVRRTPRGAHRRFRHAPMQRGRRRSLSPRSVSQDGRPCDSRKFSAPLEAEGVNFLPDGRVDMERFYFQPQEEV